jgi:hypothetical protein
MNSKDNTSNFIRKLAKKLNFNLKPYKGESEMRTITNFFLGKDSPYNNSHSMTKNEFQMTRDMVCLSKV